MLEQYSLRTDTEGFTDITCKVEDTLAKSGVKEGVYVVFCPHTTAGVTINENADPDVRRDMLLGLAKALPRRSEFRHAEGNSDAHLKAGCVGSSVTVIVRDGKLLLGTWQGIYFCEFDGPRSRTFYVKVIGG